MLAHGRLRVVPAIVRGDRCGVESDIATGAKSPRKSEPQTACAETSVKLLDGWGQIAQLLSDLAGVPISTDQARRYARRRFDPLPARRLGRNRRPRVVAETRAINGMGSTGVFVCMNGSTELVPHPLTVRIQFPEDRRKALRADRTSSPL